MLCITENMNKSVFDADKFTQSQAMVSLQQFFGIIMQQKTVSQDEIIFLGLEYISKAKTIIKHILCRRV